MTLTLRVLLLSTLLAAGFASSHSAVAQAPIEPVSIEVAGTTVVLSPPDADLFQRRLNQPPQLEEVPSVSAPSFVVSTPYWDTAVRANGDEPEVELDATYFPQGGLVRASQDGEDVWLVLDLRQRAILDYYVRYAIETPSPMSRPGALEIIRLAAQTEIVEIDAGGSRLSSAEARAFWRAVEPIALAPEFIDPPQSPALQRSEGYWLTFSLATGRVQQYFLNTADGSLTDALGAERYDAAALIGAILPETAVTPAIQQDEPAGSQLWWLLGIAGAATLFLIAFWTRRQQVRT